MAQRGDIEHQPGKKEIVFESHSDFPQKRACLHTFDEDILSVLNELILFPYPVDMTFIVG